MRGVTVLAAALCLSALRVGAVTPHPAANAQEPPSSSARLRRMVETLVLQLDSAKLSERVHAERQLLDAGPEILKYLPAPDLTPSASVRESVKRIRVQLERQAARESARASLVQLSGKTTVADVLQEITRQTRNRVELAADAHSLAGQSLVVGFDNQPFWNCLDDLNQRLNLRAVFDAHQGLLTLRRRVASDPAELAVQRTGPFRLSIQSAEIRPIVGQSSQRLLRISGRVALEPRLRPLFLHFAADNVLANGPTGKQLSAWNPAAAYELPVGDAGRDVPVQFDYVLPGDDDRTTIDIRGRLYVQLAAGTERIEFDRTSQTPGAARRRGGVTVRLRRVSFEPLPDEQFRGQIRVTVTYDVGGPAFESHRTWMFHNSVYLEDESGQRHDFTEYDTLLQVDGAIGVDYRWERIPGPATRYRFVYEAPTLILDVPLGVRLESVAIHGVNRSSNPGGKAQ